MVLLAIILLHNTIIIPSDAILKQVRLRLGPNSFSPVDSWHEKLSEVGRTSADVFDAGIDTYS